MRRVLLIAIFVLSIFSVYGKTVDLDLYLNQSYEGFGKNITLLNVDTKEDKAVICINQQKFIISNDRSIDNILLEIGSFKKDFVRMDISDGCDRCKCETNCDNSVCFDICDEDSDCETRRNFNVECKGKPKDCVYTAIIEEVPVKEVVKKTGCSKDSECDDGDKCTVDNCDEDECYHTKIDNCANAITSGATTEVKSSESPAKISYYLIFLVAILGLLFLIKKVI